MKEISARGRLLGKRDTGLISAISEFCASHGQKVKELKTNKNK